MSIRQCLTVREDPGSAHWRALTPMSGGGVGRFTEPIVTCEASASPDERAECPCPSRGAELAIERRIRGGQQTGKEVKHVFRLLLSDRLTSAGRFYAKCRQPDACMVRGALHRSGRRMNREVATSNRRTLSQDPQATGRRAICLTLKMTAAHGSAHAGSCGDAMQTTSLVLVRKYTQRALRTSE